MGYLQEPNANDRIIINSTASSRCEMPHGDVSIPLACVAVALSSPHTYFPESERTERIGCRDGVHGVHRSLTTVLN